MDPPLISESRRFRIDALVAKGVTVAADVRRRISYRTPLASASLRRRLRRKNNSRHFNDFWLMRLNRDQLNMLRTINKQQKFPISIIITIVAAATTIATAQRPTA